MKNKIHCICPCCGQERYVSIQKFNELQRYALTYHSIVTVLPDDGEEKEQTHKKEG